MSVWQILVPQSHNHMEFTDYLLTKTSGYTQLWFCIGVWKSPESIVIKEGMIPYLIATDRPIIEEICEWVRVNCEQQVVLAFKISDELLWHDVKSRQISLRKSA